MDNIKLYGVSSGNGNNGVSQLHPDYYVRTNQPYRLARLATITDFKEGKYQQWALKNVMVDGEADYTIAATIYNPPCESSEDGEYPDSEDDDAEEDGRNYSEHNGAWMIIEVFSEDDEPRQGVMVYSSLENAFTQESLDLVAE